ncbi:MAG TPA: L-threonylcarbamoyladenylate synthase [Actinomycetota bacterium]|nr:L-threonylcarbamoyladenylate synthase [Actinomycetota bacterium]
MEIFEVDPARPEIADEAIDAAAAALVAGKLVVLPTETVYGIAARPDHESATRDLFEAKRRPAGLNLPVLAPTSESAWTVGVRTEGAGSLASEFWPGALTLVLRRTEIARDWYLGEEPQTVGVRVPDHPIASHLLARTGPIVATSANLSGQPPLNSREDLVGAFGNAVAVYLVLAPGLPAPHGQASTVADLTGGAPKVLREGPISEASVHSAFFREAQATR